MVFKKNLDTRRSFWIFFVLFLDIIWCFNLRICWIIVFYVKNIDFNFIFNDCNFTRVKNWFWQFRSFFVKMLKMPFIIYKYENWGRSNIWSKWNNALLVSEGCHYWQLTSELAITILSDVLWESIKIEQIAKFHLLPFKMKFQICRKRTGWNLPRPARTRLPDMKAQDSSLSPKLS